MERERSRARPIECWQADERSRLANTRWRPFGSSASFAGRRRGVVGGSRTRLWGEAYVVGRGR